MFRGTSPSSYSPYGRTAKTNRTSRGEAKSEQKATSVRKAKFLRKFAMRDTSVAPEKSKRWSRMYWAWILLKRSWTSERLKARCYGTTHATSAAKTYGSAARREIIFLGAYSASRARRSPSLPI